MGKFIIHANPDKLTLAARTASTVSAVDFEWPDDGWVIIAYNHPDGATEATFSARKNKGSITVREFRYG